MRHRILLFAGSAAVGLVLAACGSGTGGSSNGASPQNSGQSSTVLKTAKVGGATVLANSSGRTLYWFAPDTSAKSACNGACAQTWPPVPGSSHEQTHVSGHVNTIKRSDGATQVTFNGHPLYTYTADSGPGQANGNGINAFGGVWHDVTVSGSGSGSTGSTPSSGGGGGGY